MVLHIVIKLWAVLLHVGVKCHVFVELNVQLDEAFISPHILRICPTHRLTHHHKAQGKLCHKVIHTWIKIFCIILFRKQMDLTVHLVRIRSFLLSKWEIGILTSSKYNRKKIWVLSSECKMLGWVHLSVG